MQNNDVFLRMRFSAFASMGEDKELSFVPEEPRSGKRLCKLHQILFGISRPRAKWID